MYTFESIFGSLLNSYARVRVRASLLNCSAARLSLRDVAFDFFEIDAEDGADETTTLIINVYLRNRVDIKLLYDRGSPIHDIDFSKHDLGIVSRHLLEAR